MSPFVRWFGCFILVLLTAGLTYERAVSTGAFAPKQAAAATPPPPTRVEPADVDAVRRAGFDKLALLEVPAPPNLNALFPSAASAVASAASDDPLVYRFVTADMIARRSEPSYPDECRRGAADEEFISVRFQINERGWVEAPQVVDATNDCFLGAAIQAARQTRFQESAERRTIGESFVLRYRFAKPNVAERIE